MKNILLILFTFIFSMSVSANENIYNEYQQALKAYKTKNYESSYTLFSKLYLTKLSDAKLNFYLGRSAYEIGHYEMALAAFERVQMLENGNLRNTLEMGRTYFMLKMYENAEIAFREVLQNQNIPQNVRRNIELYLSKVTKVQQKSFTYATLALEMIYDSNVNYGSLDSEYNINTGTLPSEDEISDVALQFYGDITNIYDIGDKNGFAIKNRFIGMYKDYKKDNRYDVSYISYTPSLLYSETKYLIDIAIGIDDLFIAKQNYLMSYYIMPRYEYAHYTTLRSIVYFKYQKKDFQRETEVDLNANHYELSYSLQKIISPRSYLQGTLTGINESKTQGNRIDVDYDEYRAQLMYVNQFTSVYGTDIFMEYRKRDYADFTTLFASTRTDNGGTLSASLNAMYFQSLQFSLKGTYNRVESNQDRYTYQKYTISLGLNKTF